MIQQIYDGKLMINKIGKFLPLLVIFSFLFCGMIFAAEGDVIWTRTHNGSANSCDGGYGIAVDASGNVYVTGCEYVIGEWFNIWVRKYDSDGNEIWTRTYNGTSNDWDEGHGIAVDRSGNVYVIGDEYVTGESSNIWVRKYDSNGNEIWTRTYNGTGNGWDEGYDIAIDGSGNVCVTGYESVTEEGRNIWVRKYDTDGDVIWTRTYNGTTDGSDVGNGIAVDGNGNVYVTGSEYKSDTERSNIWVRKYDSNGNEVWTRTYNGSANYWDEGHGIAVDGSSNVYVTGYEWVTGEWFNIWVRKYDSNGNEVWTRTYNGSANSYDYGKGIAVDESGNVYVTGYEWVTGEWFNIWVRKYDSNGNEIWTRTYNGSANYWDEGHGIAVDGSGNVYVTGYEYVTGEDYNIWVRKYEGAFGEHFQPPVEGMVKIQGGEKGYVNPLKGEVAKIHLKPIGTGTVNVKIFTLRGLLVWEESKEVSGLQDFIEWDCRNTENSVVASGIYVVYVEGPGIKATKKVAILK
jgi:hypothetical protein